MHFDEMWAVACRGICVRWMLGRPGPCTPPFIMDGLQDVRTVLEADFGHGVVDINYFGQLQERAKEARVFICGRGWHC